MSRPYEVVTIANDSSSCTYYRTILPTAHTAREAIDDVHFTMCDPDSFNHLPGGPANYDAFWFGRTYRHRNILQLVMRLHRMGKAIIWDLDDDLFGVPDWSPVKGYFTQSTLGELELCLDCATVITASTARLGETLAARLPHVSHKIVVLENLVDFRWYDRARSHIMAGRRPGPIRVLWTGSHTHASTDKDHPGDIGPFLGLYRQYRDDDRFLFFTYGHYIDEFKAENPMRLVQLGWSRKEDYEPILSVISPSITIIPLSPHPFNVCKSAIKYYEASLAGSACICSDMPPYSDILINGVNGVLAGEGGWAEAFEGLASSPWRMSQIQENAYDYVSNAFSWGTLNPRRQAWIDFVRSLPSLGSSMPAMPSSIDVGPVPADPGLIGNGG